MSWTTERVEQLTQLWRDGFTASQIANQLGGVTRNAVIGKAHRLGLSGRPSPIKKGSSSPRKTRAKTTASRPRKRTAPKKAAAPRKQGLPSNVTPISARRSADLAVVDQALGAEGGIGMMELSEKTCRWPVGDPKSPGFKFCGAQAEEGKSYCAQHAAVAFQRPRREEQAAPQPAQILVGPRPAEPVAKPKTSQPAAAPTSLPASA